MVQSQQPGQDGGVGTENDVSLGPEDSLALIEREGSRARRSLCTSPAPFMICWGIGVLIIFAGFYLAVPGGPRVWTMTAAMVTLGLVIVACVVFSAVYGARSGRGVRGGSRVVGALYGFSWPLAFCALGLLNSTYSREFGLTEEQNGLLWSGTAMLLIGAMYMISGAIWRSGSMYALGVAGLLASVGCVLIGSPGNLLVMGAAFGGGLLVTGFYQLLAVRRVA